MALGEGDLLVDLECGNTTSTASDEEGSGDSVSVCTIGRRTSSRACSGALSCNGIIGGESGTDSSDGFLKSSDVACEKLELLIEKSSGGEELKDVAALHEKRNSSEPRKKSNFKKASKPPRPPKGPLLNASDLKLVKELSELAARKRARIERIKALRKLKETKRPTWSSNLTAMVITILFFIVIILQAFPLIGVLSGNNARKELHESPGPATAREGLISIQLFNNAPISEMNQPTPQSLDPLGQPSSASPREEEGRDAG